MQFNVLNNWKRIVTDRSNKLKIAVCNNVGTLHRMNIYFNCMITKYLDSLAKSTNFVS